jgi:hypothetical protein
MGQSEQLFAIGGGLLVLNLPWLVQAFYLALMVAVLLQLNEPCADELSAVTKERGAHPWHPDGQL